MKEIFNNKIKTIKKKENRNIDILDTTHYNIENFKFQNNQLLVSGWLYDEVNKIEDVRIILKIKNKEIFAEVLFQLERLDVYNYCNFDNAHNSGFLLDYIIINFKKLNIILEYNINQQKKRILLGKIENSWKHVLRYYFKKINFNTLRNIIKYIKNGMLWKVIKAQRIPTALSSISQIADANIAKFIDSNVVLNIEYPAKLYDYIIDIIIPIYNGYDYLEKLFSSISLTQMNYNLIIINDNSSDKRVYKFLKEFRLEHRNITLIENEKNLGFVKSVNKGLKLAQHHVVLLNTDIELPNMWIERLMLPIIMYEDIASSTPFTNCGTICSFPNFGEDNELFEFIDLESIDKGFQNIRPRYASMPTGIGFCMGLNQEVIKAVGYLDDKTFSKGYGEENDWCQRAINAGYKNVHVENLYVYHKHGGSFLSEEKEKLLKINKKLLLKKHPNYESDVSKFCEINPSKDIRSFMTMKLISDNINGEAILVLDHNIGGGATSYINNKMKKELTQGSKVIIVRYDYKMQVYLFSYKYGEYEFNYHFINFIDIVKILDSIKVETIYINELVTYPKLYEVFDILTEMKKKNNIRIIMLLHDYFAICPATNLLDNKGDYCNIPDIERCEKCIKSNPYNNYLEYGSMKLWREKWDVLLHKCDEIIVFSQSSVELLKKAYGKIENIYTIPHQVNYLTKLDKKYKTTQTLNIGLLGILNDHKGISIVKQILNIIKRNKMKIKIILIGESSDIIVDDNFFETGKYTIGNLPSLIIKNDIDIFFITSIWPETFSYTTEEIIRLDMPIAVFNLGAPAERVNNYYRGLIIDKLDAEYALNTIENFVNENKENRFSISPYVNIKILFIAEYISFSSRYRVDHMMEQLLVQGMNAEFCSADSLEKLDLHHYHSVVIYRCRKSDKMEKFINELHQINKKVFYDIDDFIFEYGSISNLDFLKGEEYRKFDTYSRQVKECMSMCDGILTSTENLKKAILTYFPSIPVCVNRNVASLEMVILSLKSKEHKTDNNEKVILGYFSGSKTHDADFDIIADVILELLEENENVYLKTGGCIELDQRFQKYKKQILHFDFVDWRNLPEMISTVDINLMPLEDTVFHSCKSENKWLEAGLVGIPTVASRNNELEMCIDNGITGFLCSDNDEWKLSLNELIFNNKLRNEIGGAAHKEILLNKVSNHTGVNAMKFII